MAPLLVLAEALAIHREFKRNRPDYINSHWLVPSGLLATLALLLQRPRPKHVITVHAADYDLLMKWPGGKTLIRFMAKRAALVLVSPRFSEGIKKLTRGKARLLVQPMGVDSKIFRFDEPARAAWRAKLGKADRPLVLFVGKLSAKKGVDVLLHAAHKLAQEGLAFRLVIAGAGELESELKWLAKELRLADRAVFLGAVPNREIAGLYSAADVVAVPSIRDPEGETEGMPVVILEALAAGRPVVATRLCSPPPELVGKGVIAVEPENFMALAQAIKDALAGKSRVDPVVVARYDLHEVAKKYAGLFLEKPK
jgi:glycosyltransferase involved in cell wall biosynthesis